MFVAHRQLSLFDTKWKMETVLDGALKHFKMETST